MLDTWHGWTLLIIANGGCGHDLVLHVGNKAMSNIGTPCIEY